MQSNMRAFLGKKTALGFVGLQSIRTSLPLQILLNVNAWFTMLWTLSNVLLLTWKRRNFYYSAEAFGWEFTMVIFMGVTDMSRQTLATNSNMTGKVIPMFWACGLSVPVLIGYCFYLRLQSYVLQLDIILNSFGLVFVSLGLLFKLWSLVGSSVNTFFSFSS